MHAFSLSFLSYLAIFARATAQSPANAALQDLECRCGAAQFLMLPHANITSPEKAQECSSYKLIDARGTAEPQGVSTMFYPMIQNILANITDGVSHSVEYPAGPAQNTTSGENYVVDVIQQGLRDCPGQKYALFGYSQGASLILKTLEKLDSAALDMVKSVVLVGNPYRIPRKMSNVDETAKRDNATSVGMFVSSAISNNGTIPQLSKALDRSGKVLDYCLAGDGVCSYNPACGCATPAGHLSYGLTDTVQTTAFEHVVSKIAHCS